MLCKIYSFHGGDYEEKSRILGFGAVWVFRTDVSEEHVAPIFEVKGILHLGTTLALTSRPNHSVKN
jgi:hypothetical protein